MTTEGTEIETTEAAATGTLTRDRVALAQLMEQEDWDGVRLFAEHYQEQHGEPQLRQLFEAVKLDHPNAWSHYQQRLPVVVEQPETTERERER